MPIVSSIAAITKDRGLGYKGDLLFRIPDDLKRFKELTVGCPVIMGRRTHESIGRALPGRMNIVVSRQPDISFDGCVRAANLESALSQALSTNPREIFIIGGAEIYTEALPKTKRLYLTCIDAQKEADVFFPDYSDFTKEIFREERVTPEGLKYTWVTLEKP